VLVLTHYVGLPAPEVATILGIPVGTVYSRLHHGTRAMRSSLTRSSGVPRTSAELGR
jgi:DNA-directed RNA polymerase specialized sigma24 family protein